MMAALYGELSESEERAFHRLLEADDVLRAEWNELQESRNVLAAWQVEERVPSFVLLEGAAERNAASGAPPAGGGWFRRLIEPLRGFGTSPAWGLATAVVAILAFLIADSRVDDKVSQEIAALEARSATQAPTGMPRDAARPAGVTMEEFLAAAPGSADSRPGGEIVPASAEYVTQAELQARNDALVQSLVRLLNEYGERHDQSTLDLMQAMYERVNQQQLYDYRQLAGSVEDVRQELRLNRTEAEQQIEDLLGPAGPRKERNDQPPTSEDGEE
jgi:hypothetical protein